MAEPSQVTILLQQISAGNTEAMGQLFPLVLQELKLKARQLMQHERPNHTLQATALVNELFTRMAGGETWSFESRKHFYNTASEAMRYILVDYARKKNAKKRGGGAFHLDIDNIDVAAPQDDFDWEALDRALDRLKAEDERYYRVVMMRYFAGLSFGEIASMLEISPKTAQRHWKVARVFLLGEMTDPDSTK